MTHPPQDHSRRSIAAPDVMMTSDLSAQDVMSSVSRVVTWLPGSQFSHSCSWTRLWMDSFIDLLYYFL